MSRYIDVDVYLHKLEELIRARLDWRSDGRNEIQGLDVAICELENQPTADVKEVEHGTWIEAKNPNMFHRCTNCGALWGDSLYYNFHYCPTCGAKMESLKDHKLLHDMEGKRRIIVFLTTDSDDESACLKDDLRQEIACCWNTFNIVKITEIDMR